MLAAMGILRLQHFAFWVLASLTAAFVAGCGDDQPGMRDPACTRVGIVCSRGLALNCREGGVVSNVENCVADSLMCDATAGGCVECTSLGSSQCRDGAFIDCSTDGTIVSRDDCGARSLMCDPVAGCTVCSPSRGSCEGNTPVLCNGSGTALERGEPCAEGTQCDASDGICRDLCAEAAEQRSYVSCDYFATTSANAVAAEFEPAIVVSNPQSIEAVVTVRGPSGERVFNVASGAVETIRLEWLATVLPYETVGADRVPVSMIEAAGSYRVTSTVPVTVYQFNPLDYRISRDCASDSDPVDGECFAFSNDASLLLPTNVLTGDYLALSRPTLFLKQEAFDGVGGRLAFDDSGTESLFNYSHGFVTIVGADDGPVDVTIESSAFVVPGEGVEGMAPGDTQTITLSPGVALQLLSGQPPEATCSGPTDDIPIVCPPGVTGPCRILQTYCDVDETYDLTGTRIRATGKVAVVSGHECAFVPHNRWACDHLEESMFPLQAWGNRVVASVTQPLRAEPNLFRILAGGPSTVTFSPAVHEDVTLSAGQFVEFEANEDFEVVSTGPINVGQFIVGQDYAGFGTAGATANGDPSFSLGIPVEQFRTRYSFLAPTTFEEAYVNVVAPLGQDVMLDGERVEGDWRPIGDTSFQSARVPISAGAHVMEAVAGFGITVYGFGSYTSYMYPGGLDLKIINLI